METPLGNDALRQVIFSYVGPGYMLFISAVCKDWRDSYAQVEQQAVIAYRLEDDVERVVCTAKDTCSASPACLRCAVASGLGRSPLWTEGKLLLVAGQLASIDTLHEAQKLGMLVAQVVLIAAALSGCVYKVELLWEEQGYEELPGYMLVCAAQSGSVEMLSWLIIRGCESNEPDGVSAAAAAAGHQHVLEFLQEEGWDWHHTSSSSALGALLSAEVVARARLRVG
jgi:hypothetical protein